MRRLQLWGLPIVYMGFIFYLSSQSSPLPEVTSRVWDKLLHFIEYGGLAVLWYRALAGEGLPWLAAALLSVTASSLYGASDEWHQAFVPLRHSSVVDWIADTVGATLAIAGCTVTKLRLKPPSEKLPRRHGEPSLLDPRPRCGRG